MAKIPESCSPVKARLQLESALLEAETILQRTMELRLTELLIAIVSHVLGRPYHRRERVSRRLRREGRCCRCGSRASHRFSRNGFRKRCLLTGWGLLAIHLPPRCGGGTIPIPKGVARVGPLLINNFELPLKSKTTNPRTSGIYSHPGCCCVAHGLSSPLSAEREGEVTATYLPVGDIHTFASQALLGYNVIVAHWSQAKQAEEEKCQRCTSICTFTNSLLMTSARCASDWRRSPSR
jgi:hypothetical protein